MPLHRARKHAGNMKKACTCCCCLQVRRSCREGTKVCVSFFIISASLAPIRFLGVPCYFVATYAGRLVDIAWSYVSSSGQLLLYRERRPGRGRYRYRITEQRLVDCLCRNIHSSPPGYFCVRLCSRLRGECHKSWPEKRSHRGGGKRSCIKVACPHLCAR